MFYKSARLLPRAADLGYMAMIYEALLLLLSVALQPICWLGCGCYYGFVLISLKDAFKGIWGAPGQTM